jgi:Fic family protein
MKRSTGHYETCGTAGESFKAFIPDPLPPHPAVQWTPKLHGLMEKANQAVGRLDGLGHSLPDVSVFLYSYIRKEALLSSQIEGTQSSFSDLLLFEDQETPGVPLNDVQEVSNYVAAMNHGLKRLKGGFPLSLRLMKEIHAVLLSKGRGSTKMPGEFRRSQNWVGGSRPGNAFFVPPPANAVLSCLGDLEKFLHEPKDSIPVLVKAALGHVQFETIHPFLDGNGRLGRLLITLLLCAEGVLTEPILYISIYFKTHRNEYYERLSAVRARGDWEGWLEYFLQGISETAETASESARQILRLFEQDQEKISKLGRATESALRIHHFMRKKPLVSIATIMRELNVTFPTVNSSLKHLNRLGIVKESTGRKRGRLFTYSSFLQILNKGTEPLPFR